MNLQITESQYLNLLNVLNKKVILEARTDLEIYYINKAIKCGYKSTNSWKKNKYECPSKFLINAKKCGWSDILSYEVSGFKCTPNKLGRLSVNERSKLNKLRFDLGDTYKVKPKKNFIDRMFSIDLELLNPDRPDIVKKNYCKPYCISDRISCFIRVAKENKEKIKSKLGSINDSQLEFLMKIAIGIVGWQSDYGNIDRLYDIKPQELFGITIHPWDVYKSPGGRYLLKQYAKKKNINEPSFGPAEFKISEFENTGIESEFGYGIDTFIGSVLATMVTTWNAYKSAKNLGLSSGPSENLIAKNNGIWDSIKGTGNHLWDLSISVHTWPKDKMIRKYCKTSHPLFAGPCDSPTYSPFKTEQSWKDWKNSTQAIQSYYKKTNEAFPNNLKVLQSDPILNYYPFLSGAHGEIKSGQNDNKVILESVANRLKNFSCVNLGKTENFPFMKTSPDIKKIISRSSNLA